MARRQYTPVPDDEVWTAEQVEEALVNWGRAEGTRLIRAVAFLLAQSGLARSWPDFQFSLQRSIYTDPDEPDPKWASYPVARVLDWGAMHNDIPFDEVGKVSHGLFVWARMFRDRSWQWNMNDALEWMPKEMLNTVLKAFAIYSGHADFDVWLARSI